MSSKKKYVSIIEKLRNRENTGLFDNSIKFPHNTAQFLFKKIPDRSHYYVANFLRQMSNHILMGLTQCGTFLVTYIVSTGSVSRSYAGPSTIKYKLYFWRFSPGLNVEMAGELPLFEGCTIHHIMTLKFAQWPSAPDKILVYGHCKYTTEDETEKYYITITSLPPRNKCSNCVSVINTLKAAKESELDEQSADNIRMEHDYGTTDDIPEEISASITNKMSERCLKHALTVHTMVPVVPPYPEMKLFISMKNEDNFVINTGSYLHVLSFYMKGVSTDKHHNFFGMSEEQKEELHHKIGSTLITRGLSYKIPNSDERNCCITSVCNANDSPIRQAFSQSDYSSVNFNGEETEKTENKSSVSSKQNPLKEVESKIYEFADNIEDGCNLKFKWFRRRTKADKMYEFRSENEDMENIHPQSYHRLSLRDSVINDVSSASSVATTTVETIANRAKTNFTNNRIVVRKNSDKRESLEWPLKAVDNNKLELLNYFKHYDKDQQAYYPFYHKGQTSSSDYDHADNFDYLSYDHNYCCDHLNNTADMPMELSSEYDNVNLDPSLISTGETENRPQSEYSSSASSSSDSGELKSKIKECYAECDKSCLLTSACLQSERHYIDTFQFSPTDPVYDLIYEGTTESDEVKGELPMSVLGSCFTEMRLVDNVDVLELLGIQYCTARQDSIDIEEFCHKAASIICYYEGLQFLHVNNYDLAVVDVCPLNGDILLAVVMQIDFQSSNSKLQNRNKKNSANYELDCIFVWNPKSAKCSLEAYSPFKEAHLEDENWNPAREKAKYLKSLRLGFFDIPIRNKVRVSKHSGGKSGGIFFDPESSLKYIRDEYNMICLHREEITYATAGDGTIRVTHSEENVNFDLDSSDSLSTASESSINYDELIGLLP